MGVTARKIEVVIGGSSGELITVTGKAKDALKGLAATATKVSQDSLKANETTIKSNTAVGASYEKMLTTVRASGAQVMASAKTQMTAQRDLAKTTSATAGEITVASERQAKAQQAAGVVSVKASGASAKAARENAAAQAKAADLNVASATKAKGANEAAFASGSSALVKLGKATVLGTAAVALGSLDLSAKFQAAMTRLETQAGATHKQVQIIGPALQKMEGEIGTKHPQEFAEGMYHIVSSMNAVLPASTRTAEELVIFSKAAELAKVGNTGVEETAYAVGSAMNALHLRAKDATKTVGELNAIVGSGDMTLHDLTDAMKSGVLPTAQAFGTGLQSVGAALAVFGDEGIRGAAAGTKLRMMFALLGGPTKKSAEILTAVGVPAGEVKTKFASMTEALHKAGVSTTQVAEDLRKPDGIYVALSDLKHHLEAAGISATGSAAVITRAFGGGRTSAGITMLINSLPRLQDKFNQAGKTAGEFGTGWHKTSETMTNELEKVEGAAVGLGQSLGHDLEPEAKTLLKDLVASADWLGKNKAAAETLAVVITSVLGVAVAAFVANRLTKMVEGLKQMGAMSAYLRGGFSSPTAKGTPAAVAGTGGLGISGVTAMTLTGTRGAGVGSALNPLAVVIEEGTYGGLGGRAAPIGSSMATNAEKAAATGTGAQGTLFGSRSQAPVGVGKQMPLLTSPGTGAYTTLGRSPSSYSSPSALYAAANPTTEAAASAGMVAGVKNFIGPMLANLMKGGMIAGLGVLASQVAGSAIGGKAGSTVSAIGSPTAIGAGIGTVIAPGLGTAIGAGLGAAVGVLKSIQDGAAEGIAKRAAKEAHGVATGGINILTSPEEKAKQEAEFNAHRKKLQTTEHPQTGKQGFEALFDPFGLESHHGTGIPAAVALEQRKLGEEASHIFAAAYGQVKFPSLHTFATGAIKKLNEVEGPARLGAAKAMVAYADELEKRGRLPKGSVDKLIKSLEGQFPALATYVGQAGLTTAKSFTDALNLSEAEKNMQGVVSTITKDFGIVPASVGTTMKELEFVVAHSQGAMKATAQRDLTAFRNVYSKEFAAIREHVADVAKGTEARIAALSKNMPLLGAPGFAAYSAEVEKFAGGLATRVTAGVESVSSGVNRINKILEAELGEMGMPKSMGKALVTGKGKVNLKESPFAGTKKLAQGGLVQLGRPGEAGRDTIPLSIGGNNIVAGAGETVAVFTRHQRAAAEASIPGGLSSIFANKTPNYMAQGGFTPGQAYPGPQGRTDQGVDYAGPGPVKAVLSGTVKSVGLWPGWPGTGGVVYNTPKGLVYVMEDFAPSVSAGQKLTLGQIIGQDTGGKYGIETGWANAAGSGPLTPYGGSKDGTAMPGGASFRSFIGGGGGSGVSGAGAAATWNAIQAPTVGGSGVISRIAQAALNRVAGAANRYGEKAIGGASAAGSAGGHAAGSAQMKAWAKAGLEAAGVPATPGNISAMVYTMTRESGGNPRSENTTDSNARAGHPSRGLMELIPENFAKYHVAGTSSNVFDPVANVAASARYMLARYGHIVGMSPYGRGGFVGMSKGGILGGKKVTPHAKPRGTGGKNTKHPAHSPKPSFGSLITGLSAVPGIENVGGLVQPEARLKLLGQEQTSLSQMSGNPLGTFILPSDMQYFTPTIQPGESLTAGMTVNAGEAAHQKAVNALKGAEEPEELGLQGSLLSWIGGLDNHRLLTSSEAGHLAQYGGANGGISLPAMSNYFSDEGAIFSQEILWQQNVVKVLAETAIQARKADTAYRERKKVIEAHLRAKMKRYQGIKKHLQALKTGSLKARLKTAQSSAARNVLLADVRNEKNSIAQAIANTHANPGGLKGKLTPEQTSQINNWKAEDAHLTSVSAALSQPKSAVKAAQLALIENDLKLEQEPIEQALMQYGGSKTSIGKGGEVGVMGKYVAQIKAQLPGISSKGTEAAGAITTLQTSLEEVTTGLELSAAGIAPTLAGKGTAPNAEALLALLTQQQQQEREKGSIQTAQFAVFKNFLQSHPHYGLGGFLGGPTVPHFDQGGPVVDDTLAMVHRGEHVVPRDGALVMSGGGRPEVHLHHETHIHGNADAFIDAVDSRVTHPANVREISHQVMQRTGLVGGRSR